MRTGNWVLGLAAIVGLFAIPVLRADDVAVADTGSVVDFVNEQIRIGWEDNEVTPSDRADDAEWLRRVYLDIVGHIPPADVVESFITNEEPDKRLKLITQLLEDPGYVRNFTAIWTNVLLGAIPLTAPTGWHSRSFSGKPLLAIVRGTKWSTIC